MSEGLKPCPFCGEEAELMRDGRYYQVECDNCGASGCQSEPQEWVIDQWNSRPASDSISLEDIKIWRNKFVRIRADVNKFIEDIDGATGAQDAQEEKDA